MTAEDVEEKTRDELFSDLRRLKTIVLDKLEQGSREGTLDQAQIRLLSSIAMRCIALSQEILNPRPRRGLRREAREAEKDLAASIDQEIARIDEELGRVWF